MPATLASIRRYPVKSMLGEKLDSVHITREGLSGDRRYALVDAVDGTVGTAKNPRKWKALLTCRATTGSDGVTVELPSGETFSAKDPKKLVAALSEFLGRPVAVSEIPAAGAIIETQWPDLEGYEYDGDTVTTASGEVITSLRLGNSANPVTRFVDYSPVHLVTTASLRALAELNPDGTFDIRRYRPNLLVETPGAGFVENEWVGRDVFIGSDVVLRVTSATPRCVMTTLEQEDLPRDPALLKTATANMMPFDDGRNYPSVGVYATVLAGGDVTLDDVVRVGAQENARS